MALALDAPVVVPPVDPGTTSPTRHRAYPRPAPSDSNYTNGHGLPYQPSQGWTAHYDEKRGGAAGLPSTSRSSMGLWNNHDKTLLPGTGSRSRSTLRSTWLQLSSFLRPSTRRGSLATPPPSMVRFVLLCSLWYTTSALSSNTGKVILTRFRYPITLTFIQFGFVAGFCLLFMSPLIQFTRLRPPSKAILWNTLPMGLFQVGGHIFTSMAISRIPVSTVHTIKALSPLFTVALYAALFGVSYSPKTYLSLLPLTLGVMLACSFDISASNVMGLVCAFGSAIIFVTSNIFFKKIMPSPTSNASSQTPMNKLDKLNLLFYSSSMAFALMIPIWLYSDLPLLLKDDTSHPTRGHDAPHSVMYYFFMNGTVHFLQNIIAFVILSTTSPVTYSIASLIKRVAVICIAIVWFAQSVHPVQGFGIALTFVGLYMYNSAKGDVEKGENKMRRVEAARGLMLPTTREEHRMMDPSASPAISPTQEHGEILGQAAVSSTYERPQPQSYDFNVPSMPAQMYLPPPPSHPRSHPSPTLHIHIVPPKPELYNGQVKSPNGSYPSPPPSLDSPPSESIPLPDTIAI